MSASNSRPLVSVVTATFGQAAYIERTICSIREQTYPHIEHIVVDAGSTDGTLEILAAQEGRPGFRWISEPDRGMYDGIRKGFAMASGELFAYLNSDDVYFPWSVATLVETLEADPDAGLAFGDALWIEQGSGRQRILVQPAERPEYLRRVGSYSQPATLWRREAHERAGGFDPALRYTGDLDFYLRMAEVAPARRVDEVVAIMRSHPGMKTIADAGPMRDENDRVRAIHATAADRRSWAIAGERARAWAARRVLQVRLARSIRAGGRHGWPEFAGHARATVDARRFVLGLLPGRFSDYQVDAIRSGVDWLA